jgi:hypothetical protein
MTDVGSDGDNGSKVSAQHQNPLNSGLKSVKNRHCMLHGGPLRDSIAPLGEAR